MTAPLAALIWGAAHWLAAAAALAAVLLALLGWSYSRRAGTSSGVRAVAASLKALAILLLAACLLEPLFSGQRARPGANQFVILADNSQSMTLTDRGATRTRAAELKSLAPRDAAWLNRLAEDFDLRQYAFDTQLRAITGSDDIPFDGGASNLAASLDRVARRYQGRPLAGVLLFTDGNATDADALDRALARAKATGEEAKLPPVYPVVIGSSDVAPDINLEQVAVTQTNFEDAPVTLTAQVSGTGGAESKPVVAELLDESGKSIEKQTVRLEKEGRPLPVRFRVRPEQPGVSFYRVRVSEPGAAPPSTAPSTQPVATTRPSDEATLANNERIVAVDRGQGPYRVLYVAGRPNWEYKFLNRALASDRQVQLLGLLRIAKREAKFNFIAKGSDPANPLFSGFDHPDKEGLEQYDQPVIVRLGTEDESELRGGFPKTAEDLFRYHAVILDDLESEFFTQDQMQLLKEFVRTRGGGLLMLGGQESFKNGKYDRTPIGDLLPVYADEVPVVPEDSRYRLALTREGWLEPWIRLRPEEDAERTRVAGMPEFHILNAVRGIKPGATVLARAAVEGGEAVPALVEQRFGQGRVAALLIGDLWQWGLRRAEVEQNDMEKAWRQTVRWLVAEVPKRVEVSATPMPGGLAGDGDDSLAIRVQARDASYGPLDNAAVSVRVTGPDGAVVNLTAEPSSQKRGQYEASYVPRQPGVYRAEVKALAADGSDVGTSQTGWTSDPAAEEFRTLKPNVELLARIARATGGQVVDKSDLESFVKTLPNRHAEVTEPYVQPVWHQPWVFALAIICLAGEWGLRRWKGLP